MCVRKKSPKKTNFFLYFIKFYFFRRTNKCFIFFSSLSRSMSFDLLLVTLSLMFFNLASKFLFVIKLVISDILFSTAVNAEVVAKPLISGMLFSTSVNSVLLAKPIISGIFFKIYQCSLLVQ